MKILASSGTKIHRSIRKYPKNKQGPRKKNIQEIARSFTIIIALANLEDKMVDRGRSLIPT